MSPTTSKRPALKSLCSFQLEESSGLQNIWGLDEVGRGCIAGPVVVAAVSFSTEAFQSTEAEFQSIDDSKKIRPKERLRLADFIRAQAKGLRLAKVEAPEIDQINILQATFKAFRAAVSKISPLPELLLVDGNQKVPGIAVRQHCVIGGDRVSKTIAAASLVAKVWRDQFMIEQAKRYPGYGFEVHKGYGTAKHWEALERLGPCPLHRQSFLRKFYERRERGRTAEAQVLEFYQQQGFRLREQNWKVREGEIDLILEDDRSLRFVEVRYREDADIAMAFPEEKKLQFRQTSLRYLNQSGGARKSVHLDLAFVSPKGIESIPDFLGEF